MGNISKEAGRDWWQEMPKSALSWSYMHVSRLGRTIAALGMSMPLIVGTVSVASARKGCFRDSLQLSAVQRGMMAIVVTFGGKNYLTSIFAYVCLLPRSMVKSIGLGFKTPVDAKDGIYIDKKCPWAGTVSIRGKLLRGTVVSTKMKR